jgi:hypothetical protein
VIETALGKRRRLGVEGLDQELVRRLTTMLGNDKSHISDLKQMLKKRGVDVPEDQTPSIVLPSTGNDFVQLSASVKAVVAAAYADVCVRMPSLSRDTQLSLVLSVEARHEAYLALTSGREPFARDEERTMTRPDALKRLASLLDLKLASDPKGESIASPKAAALATLTTPQ